MWVSLCVLVFGWIVCYYYAGTVLLTFFLVILFIFELKHVWKLFCWARMYFRTNVGVSMILEPENGWTIKWNQKKTKLIIIFQHFHEKKSYKPFNCSVHIIIENFNRFLIPFIFHVPENCVNCSPFTIIDNVRILEYTVGVLNDIRFIFSFCFCHVITNTVSHIMHHEIWIVNRVLFGISFSQ